MGRNRVPNPADVMMAVVIFIGVSIVHHHNRNHAKSVLVGIQPQLLGELIFLTKLLQPGIKLSLIEFAIFLHDFFYGKGCWII